GRDTDHELLAEVFRELLLEAERRLVVNIVTVPEHAKGCVEVVLREPLHPNQQTATLSWSSRPAVNPLVERFPTAEVEVAHAKIRPLRQGKCFPQRRQEGAVNVVEDARHFFLVRSGHFEVQAVFVVQRNDRNFTLHFLLQKGKTEGWLKES